MNQPIAMLLTDDDSAASEGTRATTSFHSPSTQQGERDHAVSAEHVMHKIAEQIRANGVNGHDKRIFASPLARRLASERGIELAALTGSGPHGRIVKSDVERAVSAAPRAAPVHPESIVREPTDAAPLEAEALEIGDGAPASARSSSGAKRPRRCPTPRCSLSTSLAPTSSCRTTPCAASSPSGSPCRSRPSRISISPSTATSTHCSPPARA